MNAMKPRPFASPATETRTYSLFLAYSYILLSALGAVFVGLVVYGIITHDLARVSVGAFMSFSFYLFLRRPGRILLRDFRRRRDRALQRQANDNTRNA